jgi:hypothetical protein
VTSSFWRASGAAFRGQDPDAIALLSIGLPSGGLTRRPAKAGRYLQVQNSIES